MRSSYFAFLGLAVVLSSFGCSSTRSETPQRSQDTDTAEAIPVTSARAELRDIPAVIQATGSVSADESSNVAPKVAGKISNLSINVGDFVSSGSVIARVDDRDARLQLAGAEAALKRARVAVTQAEARLGLGSGRSFNASTIPEVRAANANYEQALAELKQAEANEKRYRELVESGDVSMVAYETYRTQRDTARTRANAAKEQLDVAVNTARQNNQAIAAAKADVESAQTQVAEAQQAIADTVVRAPFSGFVSVRPVAVGEYVSSASVVATILRTNPIKVDIQVAEADLPFVVLGRGVSAQIDAYKDRRFAGVVSAINPAVDPTSRSAIVEASIENGDNALRPGMFATVRINKEGGGKGVFVTKAAVYNDPATQAYRIFTIVDGVAKLKTIRLGPEEGDSYQILDGLEADEVVATSNLDKLYEGARVAV